MSSGLTLIVLGQAYFINTMPNMSLNGFYSSNPILNMDQESTPTKSSFAATPIIREDYTHTPGIGLHKVHSQAVTQHIARAKCKEEGGDLAIVNSEAESKVIAQLLQASMPHVGSFNPDYGFIGFDDLRVEGRYETVDGKLLSEAGFSEWVTGEPNNGGIGMAENCGSIHLDGKLNDVRCSQKFAFVCELPYPY